METVMSNTQQHQQQQNSRYQNSISSTPSSLSTSGASTSSSTSTSSSSAALSTSSHQDASNLIVNYLPQTMTEIELRTLFEKIDYVERCKLITNRWNNQSLCYGFVKYAKVESAELAIKSLNGLKLENKIIKVSQARPSCESIKGANLYVCGIPRNWTAQDLESYFSQCGQIITSRILVNPTSGTSKGVGFVRFDQRHEAEQAIEKLNGRIPMSSQSEPITVRHAKCWRECASSPASILTREVETTANSVSLLSTLNEPAPVYDNTTIGVFQAAATSTTTPTSHPIIFNDSLCQLTQPLNDLTTHQQQPIKPVQPPQPSHMTTGYIPSFIPTGLGWRICIRNLPLDAQETLLWELFGPFGAVLNVRLVRAYPNYTCKGQGYVTMALLDAANKAILALDGYNLGNRILQVYLANNFDFF